MLRYLRVLLLQLELKLRYHPVFLLILKLKGSDLLPQIRTSLADLKSFIWALVKMQLVSLESFSTIIGTNGKSFLADIKVADTLVQGFEALRDAAS